MENPLSREYELISRVYTFIKQKLKRNKIISLQYSLIFVTVLGLASGRTRWAPKTTLTKSKVKIGKCHF